MAGRARRRSRCPSRPGCSCSRDASSRRSWTSSRTSGCASWRQSRTASARWIRSASTDARPDSIGRIGHRHAPRYNATAMPDALPQVRLHNSLTRRAEPLEPIKPGLVTIYTCGSTVYKYAHIGNLRTYLFGDLLHRALEYLGYEVRYVKNITDVGHMRNDDHDSIASDADKIELAAETEGKTPAEIAEFYTAAWLEDEALLNILPVDVMPKATEHIGEMVSLTEQLVENGLAYEVDGTIYYDVSAFPHYG